MAKAGIKWKSVNPETLPKALKDRFHSYVAKQSAIAKEAKDLAAEIKFEWASKHPQGVNGKGMAIKIAAGTIQAGEVDLQKQGTPKSKAGGMDLFS